MVNFVHYSVVAAAAIFQFSNGAATPNTRRNLQADEDENGAVAIAPTEPLIPHTFWFNHHFSNILVSKEPYETYENVAETIDRFRQVWGDPVGLQFMDDDLCHNALSVAAPRLIPYYESEIVVTNRRDICRAAALYAWGGYDFDTRLGVVDLVLPKETTRFVAVSDCGGGCFSHMFVASAPNHPIMEVTLKIMLHIYESGGDTTMLGPVAMANAYHSLAPKERTDVELLDMLRLDEGRNYGGEYYPLIERLEGPSECNDVMHDPKTNTVHFFKRYRGEGGCVRENLRLDWSNVPPISQLAKEIDSAQAKCRWEQLSEQVRFKKREQLGVSGFGTDLMYMSASLCDAMDNGMTLINRNDWIWMDTEKCAFDTEQVSPLQCYFGKHESASFCNSAQGNNLNFDDVVVTAVDPEEKSTSCRGHQSESSTKEFRAASFEWLFQSVNPIVLEEAKRQVREAFEPDGLPDPEDLITVHIRWGDKWKEMNLRPIEEYVDAVQTVVQERIDAATKAKPAKLLHIYLASEDPHAKRAFWVKAPEHWIIHSSGPENEEEESDLLKNASGRAGLESLAALLVSLEANHFVLTLGSNWSHLIDFLRRNMLDPRCGNCTRMTDLSYGYL